MRKKIDLKKLGNVKIDVSREIVKIKIWYSDGSTELTKYDKNGGHEKLWTFKKEKKNAT